MKLYTRGRSLNEEAMYLCRGKGKIYCRTHGRQLPMSSRQHTFRDCQYRVHKQNVILETQCQKTRVRSQSIAQHSLIQRHQCCFGKPIFARSALTLTGYARAQLTLSASNCRHINRDHDSVRLMFPFFPLALYFSHRRRRLL